MSDEGEGEKPPAPVAPPLFKLGIIEKQYVRPMEWDWLVFKECAPQALLRDLHRPESQFHLNWWQVERIEVPLDGGRRYWRETHAEYFTRYIADVPALLHTHRDYVEGVKEHQGALKQSWSKALKSVQEEKAKQEGWEPQSWVPKDQRDQPPQPVKAPPPQKKTRFL